MITLAQYVWIAHGKPEMPGCGGVEGVVSCYMCGGGVARGMPVDKWMGASFTDQTRVRSPLSPCVCEACVMLAARTFPVLGRDAKEGKKFGACFRNVSNAVEIGWSGIQAPGYANYTKGEKSAIRAFLERDHVGYWGIGIADSGQKHVAGFAPMNPPGRGGCVIFEEALLFVPSSLALVDDMTALLTAGATKDEIAEGDYRAQTWIRCRAKVDEFEERNERERGSDWFRLALWLAQRDEVLVEERLAVEKQAEADKKAEAKANGPRAKKQAGKPVRRDGAGSAPGLHPSAQGKGPDGVLGPDPGHDPCRDEHDDHPVGVVQQCPARPADTGPRQWRLPGFD